MNSIIETLNQSSGTFFNLAWPIFWQSSLLIVLVFAIEFLLRHKLRSSFRYALWLVVLLKLCLPPTLALPTSPAWWLTKHSAAITPKPVNPHYTITYGDASLSPIPDAPLPSFVPPPAAITLAAGLMSLSVAVSSVLLLWMLLRWHQITQKVRQAVISERLTQITDEAKNICGLKRKVRLRITSDSMSPAVCGLFRPTILIPESLANHFTDQQLRAVLLHELIHLRRWDVWLNFAQTLLQILYWWHPFVWLANSRIRRVREEAVDDAVMLALQDRAESYAPTLLEVARLALNRPLASLGLVGILESRHSLRQRIERLIDFCPPRRTGLTLLSFLGILTFTAVAVPMGQAPVKEAPSPAFETNHITSTAFPLLTSQAQATNINQVPVSGIMADPHFQMTLHALQQRSNTMLFGRLFKVDTNAFRAYLSNQPGPATNSQADAIKTLINKIGVNLDSPKGKMMGYNEENNLLYVKATESDLDTISHTFKILDNVAPQLHLKARFYLLPQGTLERYQQSLKLTNSSDGSLFGVLTFQEAMMTRRTLETSLGFQLLAESEYTTLSGRHAQMRGTTFVKGATNLVFPKLDTNGMLTPLGSLETGPLFDCTSYVLSDGYTINVNAAASVTDFLGYEKTTNATFAGNKTGDKVNSPASMPDFLVQQANAVANLWDNQTVVLGKFVKHNFEYPAPEPLRGGILSDSAGKDLVVFVTVTLVDSVGNRVHSEEDMPFAQYSIPVQPSIPALIEQIDHTMLYKLEKMEPSHPVIAPPKNSSILL